MAHYPVLSFQSDTSEPTGFVDREATLSFNDANRTFTITGSHSFYQNGKKYTRETSSKQIADTTGIHYIYYLDGVLVESTDWSGFNFVLVAFVYWNTTIDNGILSDERHGVAMSHTTHEMLHLTVGCQWASGLAGTFDDTTITIASGVIFDEDLKITLAEETSCNVYYMNGDANWEWDASSSTPYKMNGSNLQYNNGTSLADASANYYVAYWVFATNIIDEPIAVLIGQRQDANVQNARDNNKYEDLTLGTLPSKEWKLLYRIIYRNVGATPDYIETQDLRSVKNFSTGTYVATDHGVLSGLTDDDHSQYALLSSARGTQAFVGTINFGDALLGVADTAGNNWLRFDCAENLGSDRILSFVTGDAARTITLSGNPTLADWFDQSVKTTASPTFAGLAASNMTMGAGSSINWTFNAGAVDPVVRFWTGAVVVDDASLDVRSSAGIIGANRYGDDNNGSFFYFRKSRNATLGSHTIVQSDDILGMIVFAGSNGTSFSNAAYIHAIVDGTPGASADMPGRLVFSTSADGAATPTERLRITSAGLVNIITDSALGIIDTNASHYLRLDCGSDLTADRVLSFVPGDAARTLTLSGNPTLADWFDQAVKSTSDPTFDYLTTTQNYTYKYTTGTGLGGIVATNILNIIGNSGNSVGATYPYGVFVEVGQYWGTSGYATSFYGRARLGDSQNLAAYYGLYLGAPVNNSGGTPGGGATITANYGLYCADTTAINYISGRVRLTTAGLASYSGNAAAVAAGLSAGDLYRMEISGNGFVGIVI